MLASGLFAGFLKVAVVAVSIGGLTAGAYYAYQIGPGGSGGVAGQIQPTLEATVSPTAAVATSAPTAEPPTPPPTSTSVPSALPTATQFFSAAPDIGCPKRMHNHLNTEKLRADSRLTGAVVSEIDISRVRIEIEGVEFIIIGWGEDVGIGGYGNPSEDLMLRVQLAVDALTFEC